MKANSNLSMRLLPATALALLLAACDGGGGGDKPDAITPFSFTTLENVDAGEPVFSNEVTLGGFKQAQAISVTGENASYCINLAADNSNSDDACTIAAGTIKAGDKLKLMTVASQESGGEASVEVRVGNTDAIRYTTTFTAVTRPDTSLPIGQIVVPKLIGVGAGEKGITDPVIVDDFDGVLTLSADDGTVRFSIDGGSFVAGPVSLRPGQSFALEIVAGDEDGGIREVLLTFTGSGDSSVTTTVQVQARAAEAAAPAPFAFDSIDGAELGTDVDASVIVDGQFTGLPITITGGEYSIGAAAAFTNEPGQISGGETLHVRVKSSDQFETARRARITVGADALAATGYFEVTTKSEPADVNRPDPFTFGKRALLQPGADVESEQVAVTGFTGELEVSIDQATPAAAAAQFAVIDGDTVGEFTTLATMTEGQMLIVKAKAPASLGEAHAVRINVGKGANLQAGNFVLATRARDTQPATFSFGDLPSAEPNEIKIYGPVTISGFDGTLPVTLEAPAAAEAKVSVNGGAFAAGGGTISSGQTLRVQVKAPAPGADPHSVRVIVGEGDTAVAAAFTVASQDVTPAAFAFPNAQVTLAPGAQADSGEATLSDFDGTLNLDVDVNADVSVDLLVNGAEITQLPTQVRAGDRVRVVTNALANAANQFAVTVSVGSFAGAIETATFAVGTLDVQADDFSFTPDEVRDANPGEEIVATSDPLSGFVGTLPASVTQNLRISFGVVRDGSLVTATDGTPKFVQPGDVIELHMVALDTLDQTLTASVQIGTGVNAVSAALPVTTADNFAPEIAVHFPTPLSTTHGETITLTGNWGDNDRVTDLLLEHASSDDALVSQHVFDKEEGTWQMTVALNPGRNDITVTGVDASGNESVSQAITVMREAPFFVSPSSVAYNATTNEMYVIDAAAEPYSIIGIDLDDNVRRVVATERVDETGDSIEYFDGPLLLDGNDLLLLDGKDSENVKLISVNTGTGFVEELASGFGDAASVEPGPMVNGHRTFYVIGKRSDQMTLEPAILHVDPAATPAVTVFSRPDADPAKRIGGGDNVWSSPVDLAFDEAAGFLYVIDNGVEDALYRINTLGTRLLVTHAGEADLQGPLAIVVDTANGVLYVTNGDGEREIVSIDVSDFGVGTHEVFRSNLDGGVTLSSPRGLAMIDRGGERFFWVADQDIQGIVEIDVASKNETVIPARTTGEGLGFDTPEALALDVQNGRLLVLSDEGIQGVNIADGHRGDDDLFTMGGSGLTLGDLVVGDDKLWVTLNEASKGLATIDIDELNGTGPGTIFTPVLLDGNAFGASSAMVIDEGKAFVATRTTRDLVQEMDLDARPIEPVLTFDSANSGGERKHMFRFDDTRIIAGDGVDLFLLGSDSDDEDTLGQIQLIFPASVDVLQNATSYAYDGERKRLYIKGRVESGAADAPMQLGWVDMEPLVEQLEGDLADADRRFTAIVQTSADNAVMPGYPSRVDRLLDLALDGERQRMFAISNNSLTAVPNEVVLINVMDVLVDEDGEPGFDRDENGDFVRRQTGETVLISRDTNGRSAP